MKAQFVNLQAAADYMGPGAIEVDRYQTEITDIVRRRGPFGQRIKQVPATGHPSRFFEETGIPSPTAANGFVDPRNITPTLVTPTRVERSVPLKCLVSQINYNVFDMEVGAQQSQFAYLQAKDLADSVGGLLRTHDVALWNGNDTSLTNPTTPQYYGAAGQINDGGGEDTTMWELAEIAMVYSLPGTWVNLDVTTFDYFPDTGEVSWLGTPLGLAFDEIEIVYTAGFSQVPDPVKFACAQLVRNAQATPALNVRAGTLNSMHLEYFADTLIDSTVQCMLAPYVAQKVG